MFAYNLSGNLGKLKNDLINILHYIQLIYIHSKQFIQLIHTL